MDSGVLGIRTASGRVGGFCWIYGPGYTSEREGVVGESGCALRKHWILAVMVLSGVLGTSLASGRTVGFC